MTDGDAYLAALDRLGLQPAACFWAYDRQIAAFVLVLVTDEYDSVGPLALSRQLFKAFEAEATPRAIDPFRVRLHSRRQTVVREIDKARSRQVALADTAAEGDPTRCVISVDALEIDADWIYRFAEPLFDMSKDGDAQVMQRWRRFANAVECAIA